MRSHRKAFATAPPSNQAVYAIFTPTQWVFIGDADYERSFSWSSRIMTVAPHTWTAYCIKRQPCWKPRRQRNRRRCEPLTILADAERQRGDR
jgi:hypothetical protein